MPSQRVISADSHMLEPANLWVDRVDNRFKDTAPRVVKTDGPLGTCLTGPGLRPFPVSGLSVRRPQRRSAEELFRLRLRGRPAQRLGPGGAHQGPGHRRRRGRGPVHQPGDAVVRVAGHGPATRLLPGLQRLAGRVLFAQSQASDRHRVDFARRYRPGGQGSGAVPQDGAAGIDGLGLCSRKAGPTAASSTIRSGRPRRNTTCRSRCMSSPAAGKSPVSRATKEIAESEKDQPGIAQVGYYVFMPSDVQQSLFTITMGGVLERHPQAEAGLRRKRHRLAAPFHVPARSRLRQVWAC